MTARSHRRSSGTSSSSKAAPSAGGGASGPFSARPSAQGGFASQAADRSPGASLQLKGPGGGGGDRRAQAESGIQGKSEALPFKAKLEASFGQDLSHVKVHTDKKAQAAAKSLGAEGYALGEHVVFATSSPSLKLVAHEVAHVVQQAEGVNLAGGEGKAGDKHEDAADKAAEKVASGESAKEVATAEGGAPGVQMKQALQLKETPENGQKVVSSKAAKRLEQARDAIAHTKSVMNFGAGNQKAALLATLMNSNYRLAVMRDPDAWEYDRSIIKIARANRDALTAAKADLAHGGNCGEHAAVAYDYLRVMAVGQKITKSSVKGLDHAFVLMGDLDGETDADIVVSDPWPTEATATVWEDHFAFDPDRAKINRHSATVADGKKIKEVIARGLRLSKKGEKMVEWAATEEKTAKTIEESKEKNWLWDHPDAHAPGKDYEYVTAEQQKAEQTAADDAPGGDGLTREEVESMDEESWWSWLWPF